MSCVLRPIINWMKDINISPTTCLYMRPTIISPADALSRICRVRFGSMVRVTILGTSGVLLHHNDCGVRACMQSMAVRRCFRRVG